MSDRVAKLVAKGQRHLQAGKIEPARKALRQALKMSPTDVQVLNRLAALEINANNAKGAVPVLRKLVQLRPDEPAIALRLSELLEDSSDMDGAEEVLRALVANHSGFAGGAQRPRQHSAGASRF